MATLAPAAQAKAEGQEKPAPDSGQYQIKTLDSIVAEWLRNPTLKHSTVGLEIMESGSNRVLYSFNGRRRFVPASTVKAITAACAYETLGKDFVFKTVVGAEGKIIGTRLKGNLIVVPSQDPTLTRAQLQQMVNNAVQLNTVSPKPDGKLTQIDGQIKISSQAAGRSSFHTAWLVEDWGRYWMPVSSNLVIDRNIAHPEGLPAIYKTMNAESLQGALFDHLLSSRYGPAWLYADRSRRINFLYRSSHPKSPKSVAFVVSNPDVYNCVLLEQMLVHQGVKVFHKKLPIDSTDRVYQLSLGKSHPLPQILRRTLRKSDNLYAQQLLRRLGVHYLQSKSVRKNNDYSLEAYGLLAVSGWLSKLGVPAREVVLFDGCGLCRKNGLSPHALNMVASHMAGKDASSEYLDLLKVNDERDRQRGIYRFKTGTMDTVRCITGVLTTTGGQNLALTIMVNGHTPSVRNLRIAVADLINRVRVIKHIGEPIPEALTASKKDANVTETASETVVVDTKAQNSKAKKRKKPRKRRSRKRRRRRHK